MERQSQRRTGEEGNETKSQLKVEIDRNPVREIGVGIKWGTVEAIQVSSPADGAFEKGDEILSVVDMDGVSPLTFDLEISRHLADGGGEIEFLVKRGGK